MTKKEDLRVIKTRNLLYSTLIHLLGDKPFEEIKVSDICEKALINRSTFYAHYADKYELFSSFINDLKKSLILELDKNTSITNFKEYYLEMLKIFFKHIDANKDIYVAIMKNNRNSIIMDMVYDVFNKDVENKIEKNSLGKKITIPSDFIAKFYLGAVFRIGIEMLENPNKYTEEDVIKYLNILIPNNLL